MGRALHMIAGLYAVEDRAKGLGAQLAGATRRLAKGDIVGQVRFTEHIFGLAA